MSRSTSKSSPGHDRRCCMWLNESAWISSESSAEHSSAPSVAPSPTSVVKEVDWGYERDRLSSRRSARDVRWWVYVALDGEDGRPQRPRLGVADRGFRFARGGRARSDDEALAAIRAASREAQAELEFWRGQPSHLLGSRGELIPLGDLLPGLPAGTVELPS